MEHFGGHVLFGASRWPELQFLMSVSLHASQLEVNELDFAWWGVIENVIRFDVPMACSLFVDKLDNIQNCLEDGSWEFFIKSTM